MTEGASFPPCFESAEGYAQWLALARAAGLQASVCDDCTSFYRQRMEREDRCQRDWVRVRFVVRPKGARRVEHAPG